MSLKHKVSYIYVLSDSHGAIPDKLAAKLDEETPPEWILCSVQQVEAPNWKATDDHKGEWAAKFLVVWRDLVRSSPFKRSKPS